MIHLYLVMVFSFITWRKTPLNQVTLSTPKTLFQHVGDGPECCTAGRTRKSTEVLRSRSTRPELSLQKFGLRHEKERNSLKYAAVQLQLPHPPQVS